MQALRRVDPVQFFESTLARIAKALGLQIALRPAKTAGDPPTAQGRRKKVVIDRVHRMGDEVAVRQPL